MGTSISAVCWFWLICCCGLDAAFSSPALAPPGRFSVVGTAAAWGLFTGAAWAALLACSINLGGPLFHAEDPLEVAARTTGVGSVAAGVMSSSCCWRAGRAPRAGRCCCCWSTPGRAPARGPPRAYCCAGVPAGRSPRAAVGLPPRPPRPAAGAPLLCAALVPPRPGLAEDAGAPWSRFCARWRPLEGTVDQSSVSAPLDLGDLHFSSRFITRVASSLHSCTILFNSSFGRLDGM
mmetsp:Transcript_9010/g.17768  ORF Transcript_9010/g.17768 Transcript_9010/m.17768 type:complete len:235 (+) Transcript_9010:2154-2858(+)